MLNYLFLKDKLENYAEENDFVIIMENLSDDGLTMKIRTDNFHFVEKFLSKYNVYEYEIISEVGSLILIKFKMKERYRKLKEL